MSKRAWVTLATNDSYGLGALVLAHSLRHVGSTYSTVVLITPSVTDAMRNRLHAVFTEVVTVDVLDSRDAAHLALLQRPELGITFTKLHCWELTQYDKCVFLDADTLVVQNSDELFEREELSAAPDVGWPDCFNSGVFVYKPSTATFDALIKFAQERGSFDGGDQGLLNSFFSDWARGDINKHLPFLYNVTSAAFYSYLPALKHYGQDLKIIHFIGAAKPWLQPYNFETRSVDAPDHIRGLLQLWWDLFVGQVHHQLDSTMVEDVEVEAPPMPPPDVAPHYEPRLDPQSEFRWHHPDAQPQDEAIDQGPDLTDFYDPWQNYRGNIPPNPDLEVSDDRQAVRDYAKEYTAPAHTDAWQPPAGFHDTHSHNEHHPHSHDQRNHNWEDHDRTHFHQTDEHHGGYHQHESGVAGNLARVVPGAAAREALDELSRRQGWEAGNIDYMGADSFANIWAKISQTLNQPRTSPPKEQPKQPSPPKEAPKQPSPPKEAPKQPSPPKEAPKQPSPPKEAPKQPSPPKEPAPKQPSPPKEAPAEVKPAEAPAETKPTEASAEAKPAEVPAAEPVADAAGKQTPLSPAAPAPAEPEPTAEPPKEEIKEKTDKPEVPPTPPATPKTTPEPSTPVAEAPAAEPLLAAAAAIPWAPAAVAAPAAPAAPEAPAAPAAVAAPAAPAAPAAVAAPVAAAAPAVAAAPSTPEKAAAEPAASDSPPLANTPSKEDAPVDPAAKSEERSRRPAGQLLLGPPAAAPPPATPDSEAEDAAALAHAIIAAELAPVSLAQIGVKPKGKSTAAQIESSVAPAGPASPSAAPETPSTPSSEAPATPGSEPSTPGAEAPSTPTAEAPKDAPKKKVVKKVVKKEGDAPVPPPRKKEKKPKEK